MAAQVAFPSLQVTRSIDSYPKLLGCPGGGWRPQRYCYLWWQPYVKLTVAGVRAVGVKVAGIKIVGVKIAGVKVAGDHRKFIRNHRTIIGNHRKS